MQLAADIIAGGANLGADGVAERERVFARGTQPPIASRVGHSELEIHCTAAVSANIRIATLRVGSAGGEAEVRDRSYGARRMLHETRSNFTGRDDSHSNSYTGQKPSLPVVVRNSKRRTSREVEQRGLG